jgi:hypothetical protein
MERVKNMDNDNGRAIPNQFIIEGDNFTIFQSYQSTIVKIVWENGKRQVYLDENTWDYSTTTGKYRNRFLQEKKAETEKKIKSGEYILTDLN